MSNLNRLILIVSGFGLVVLGTLCTAFYLQAQAADLFPFMDVGAWLAGALLELGKLGLMVAGIALVQSRQHWKASGILIICVVLSVISMFTTYQFLAIGATGGKTKAVAMQATSRAIERSIAGIEEELASIDSAIAQKVSTAERYREITYLERSEEVLSGNAQYYAMKRELLQERNELLSRLGEVQSQAVTLNDSEVIAFATIAVLIDVVGMLCVALASNRSNSPPTSTMATSRQQQVSRITGMEPSEPTLSSEFSGNSAEESSVDSAPYKLIVPSRKQSAEDPEDEVEHCTGSKQNSASESQATMERVEVDQDLKIHKVVTAEAQNEHKPAIEEELIERALEAIKDGVEPKKAAMRQVLRIADARALKVLKELERLGHLVRTGKGWSVQNPEAVMDEYDSIRYA